MAEDKWRFKTESGEVAHLDAIFPILTGKDLRELRIVGTGFYISRDGIFVTAKHCFENEAHEVASDNHFHVLHFLPENRFLLRPIVWGWHSNATDVSVGIAARMHNNKDGSPLTNQSVTLTAERPPIGTEVVTYAFGKSSVHANEGITRVEARQGVHSGRLIRYYPYGRDRRTIPWPCYETSLRVEAGASGGPVFNVERGAAFAINTSSVEGNEDVSFVTPIDVILDAEFESAQTSEGLALPRRVRELAELGWISFEPSLVDRDA